LASRSRLCTGQDPGVGLARHGAERLEARPDVGLGEDSTQPVAPEVGFDAAGDVDEPAPLGRVPALTAADRRPVVQRGRQRRRHRRPSRLNPGHGPGRRECGQVEGRVAEGDGVGRVGGRGVVLGPRGADVGQAIQQRAVATGGLGLGADLGRQHVQLPTGLGVVPQRALGLLHLRQRHPPPSQVVGPIAGLIAERPGRAQHVGHRRGAGRALPIVVAGARADDGGQRQHGGGQADRQPPTVALDLRPLSLLLGAGLGPRPLQLGAPQALLHSGEVGRNPPEHLPGAAEAVLGLRREAIAGQADQLRIGAAGIEPAQRLVQFAPARLPQRLRHAPAGKRRRAG
jgi:hypothetical protein